MNKPPERIRVFIDKKGNPWIFAKDMILEQLNSEYSGNHFLMPWREFYYTLEKPMTQKTENLTEKEAWIAMANGECVGTRQYIHRINYGHVEFWDGKWLFTGRLGVGPYSIVPDPSKQKEVSEVDELVIQFAEFVDEKVGGKYEPEQDLNQADLTRLMLDFINSKFVRKP